jgi:hypothetical protein
MVLSTPMFPLVMPPRARKKRAWANVVEKLKPTQETTGQVLALVHGVPLQSWTRRTRASEPNHQDGLAAEPARVGDASPHHGR